MLSGPIEGGILIPSLHAMPSTQHARNFFFLKNIYYAASKTQGVHMSFNIHTLNQVYKTLSHLNDLISELSVNENDMNSYEFIRELKKDLPTLNTLAESLITQAKPPCENYDIDIETINNAIKWGFFL